MYIFSLQISQKSYVSLAGIGLPEGVIQRRDSILEEIEEVTDDKVKKEIIDDISKKTDIKVNTLEENTTDNKPSDNKTPETENEKSDRK